VAAPSRSDPSYRPALAALAAVALVVSLLAVPALAAGKGGGGKPGGGTSAIGFGSAVIVNPVETYGEPDIKIAGDGTTYVSGPWGTGTQRSIWDRSVDGGRTFRRMHATPVASANDSDTLIPGPGGGDTEIAIARNGDVYYSDLAALVTLKTVFWDNANRTMQTGLIDNPLQDINGYDRQWFALWDPPTRPAAYTGPLPVNYLSSAEAIGASDCDPPLLGGCGAGYYSLDGVHYSDRTVTWPLSNDGPLVIDQQTGTVIEAISLDSTNDVGVALLTRDASTPDDPALKNQERIKIADLPDNTGTDALFPVIGLDTARNAYVAWVTRGENNQPSGSDPNAWQIFYSYATAASGWKTWSTPVKLSATPSNTNVMPWAVAGSAGRLAVVWYGTNDATHDPSTEDAHQEWNVRLAMISNAASSSPLIQQVQVTRHPSHYGTICLEGTGCIAVQGNRNNADFFYDTVDPRDGAVSIVFNDTSNELIQGNLIPPADGTVDHRGAPVVTILRQNSGVGLFGTTVSGDPTFGTSLKDASGDALFDPVYGDASVPGLDLRGASVSSSGDNFVFKVDVTSLDDFGQALTATGAGAVDYVVRWIGPSVVDPTDGTRNPIYYAAAESTGGAPTFFAGKVVTIELCSVSGCFPHITDYPAPPSGGTAVTGSVVQGSKGKPDSLVITVPKSLVGGGSLLESLSVFAFARSHSASTPITNTEGEAGILPIQVDGVCCVDAKL
jgi:hypothetical protein